MPLVTAEMVFSLFGLNDRVQVDWGRVTGAGEDLIGLPVPGFLYCLKYGVCAKLPG